MAWRILIAAMAFGLAAWLGAAPAAAQPIRTWVASDGDDGNPCSRFAPCRTFERAHFVTAPGGEIDCVDPGSYGSLKVTKSMTIDCGGMFGSTLVPTSNGFVIDDSESATPGRIIVNIRNVSINGGIPSSPGHNGIRFVRGAQLNVERVTIFNFTSAVASRGFGILIDPAAGAVRVHVADSVISQSGSGSSGGGIGVAPTGSASVRLSIENVQLTGNSRGLHADTRAVSTASAITLANSSIAGSAENAINAVTNANALSLMIEDVRIAHNKNGIVASGSGSRTRIGGSTVASNGEAFIAASGARIESFRNNQIGFNGNDGTPLPQVPLN